MFYNPLETNIGYVKKRKKDLLIKDDFPRKNCGDLMPPILRLTTAHFTSVWVPPVDTGAAPSMTIPP